MSEGKRRTATQAKKLHASALDSDGPWLIRSHYWGRWHRRSEDGGACGYTDDILNAGIFGRDKAEAYHDEFGGRDEAIPVERVISDLEHSLAEMDAARAAAAAKVQQVRAALTNSTQAKRGQPQ